MSACPGRMTRGRSLGASSAIPLWQGSPRLSWLLVVIGVRRRSRLRVRRGRRMRRGWMQRRRTWRGEDWTRFRRGHQMQLRRGRVQVVRGGHKRLHSGIRRLWRGPAARSIRAVLERRAIGARITARPVFLQRVRSGRIRSQRPVGVWVRSLQARTGGFSARAVPPSAIASWAAITPLPLNWLGLAVAVIAGRPWFSLSSRLRFVLAVCWCYICTAVGATSGSRAKLSCSGVGRAVSPPVPPLMLVLTLLFTTTVSL
jgi:hypothetical protein